MQLMLMHLMLMQYTLIFYLELCEDKDDICQYEPSCEFDRIKTECPKWCKLCSEGALHFMEYN